jgi:hypothetical protein
MIELIYEDVSVAVHGKAKDKVESMIGFMSPLQEPDEMKVSPPE